MLDVGSLDEMFQPDQKEIYIKQIYQESVQICLLPMPTQEQNSILSLIPVTQVPALIHLFYYNWFIAKHLIAFKLNILLVCYILHNYDRMMRTQDTMYQVLIFLHKLNTKFVYIYYLDNFSSRKKDFWSCFPSKQ